MKNLKVWQKLLLMGLVFMLPFGVVTWRLVSSVNTLGVEFARQEAKGVEYYGPLLKLVQELQLHRGLAKAWLSGDASFKERVAAKSMDVGEALQVVDAVDRRLGVDLKTAPSWRDLRKATDDLLSENAGLSAADSFARHNRVIADTMAFVSLVGDHSNLSLDPDLDSYYLVDLTIFKAPVLAEFLAEGRGLGAGIAAAGKATPEQLARLSELTTLIEYVSTQADAALGKAIERNPALGARLGAQRAANQDAMRAGLALNRRTVQERGTTLDGAAYFAEMTKHIDVFYQTNQRAAAELSVLLDLRIARLLRGVHVTLALSALGLVLVSALGLYIMRDITRPLGRVVAVANRIAAGDLAADTAFEPRRDELGALAGAFDRMGGSLRELAAVANQLAAGDVDVVVKPQSDRDAMGNAFARMIRSLHAMAGHAEQIAAGNLNVAIQPQSEKDAMGNALAAMVAKLSALIGQVQRSGIQVNTSVNEIAATAKEQQATANEIAATTTEIGATAKEITATSRELVKTVNEVTGVAEQTATLAGNGQTGLVKMEETMQQIMSAGASINAKLAVLNEKAGNINQVVTTITKVADQTNLLSLNAAIEAEKAGEYGRGFAVVATEIRRLADQTAVATFDIEQMVKEMLSAVSAGVMGMDKFSEEVRRGVAEVHQVGAQLGQIIQQVQALTPRFEVVNEGMQAQSTGAQQISDALAQLGEAARQTAESLRQSTEAIDQLNGASLGLKNSVEKFKLG